MNPKLTIIIPFLNEGEEVARTVKSIREHSNQEEIIILLIIIKMSLLIILCL